jgi:uncharacterized PurR-regulated membrane protein YhhQ (DUF165 family)
MKLIIALFLIAFIGANLLVKHFGAYGLWISSAMLIPFDFIVRCIIHERQRGTKLVYTLSFLCGIAALITVLINQDAIHIAAASVCGFVIAQLFAGIIYQVGIYYNRSYFVKVNGSDLAAIIVDSIVFQVIAFSAFDPGVTGGQVLIKFAGGLFWYWIFFVKLKVQDKFKSRFQQQLEKDNELFLTKFKRNEK